MNSRPTPETDAKASPHIGFYSCATVPAEFARQLERERDEARDIGERLSKQGLDMMDENRALKSEREEARKVASGLAKQADRLRKERDEAREERDIARLEFEEISNDLQDARYRIWQLKKRIEGLNNFANERYEEIQKVRKERDEAREALKKCREDSVCYAEHMRRSGYVKAFKESQENADKAMGILNKLEGAK